MNATYAHLSVDQLDFLTHCESVAREQLAPIAATGEPGRVNRALIAALSTSGLLPRLLNRGGDISAVELCLVREGLARYSSEAELAFALQGLGAHPILAAGQPQVVDLWIPRVAGGEAVAAIALTEPDVGSDLASLSLAAEHDGDGYRLSGEKVFISNAPHADIYSVFARTSPGQGSRGITAFAVPRDSEGLSGEATPLIADHAIGTLRFDGVRVPTTNVLGDVDHGFGVAMRTLDLFRPSVGAAAVGMSQAALDAAVAHAKTRTAFGNPLSALQGVTHQLAEGAMRTQAARLLVHAAAAAYDAGIRPVAQASAMAKLFATETAQFVIDVAIQVTGARALLRGQPLEHLYREVRGMRIYEGTSEIQREIIARNLFASS